MTDTRTVSARRPDRRILKTQKAICDAFTSLLREKDVDAISVTELTSRAGITRKTFYLHYSSMDEFIDSYLEHCLQSPLEDLERELSFKEQFDFLRFFRKLTESLSLPEKTVFELMENRDLAVILKRAMEKNDNEIISRYAGQFDKDPEAASYYISFFCTGI